MSSGYSSTSPTRRTDRFACAEKVRSASRCANALSPTSPALGIATPVRSSNRRGSADRKFKPPPRCFDSGRTTPPAGAAPLSPSGVARAVPTVPQQARREPGAAPAGVGPQAPAHVQSAVRRALQSFQPAPKCAPTLAARPTAQTADEQPSAGQSPAGSKRILSPRVEFSPAAGQSPAAAQPHAEAAAVSSPPRASSPDEAEMLAMMGRVGKFTPSTAPSSVCAAAVENLEASTYDASDRNQSASERASSEEPGLELPHTPPRDGIPERDGTGSEARSAGAAADASPEQDRRASVAERRERLSAKGVVNPGMPALYEAVVQGDLDYLEVASAESWSAE